MNIINPNLTFKPLTYNNVPDKTILHHADASVCSVYDVHRWHINNGWVGIGYHYFVRKDGSVYKGRPDNAQGAQCSGSNTTSIGVCCEGSFDTEHMPEVQKQAVIELCKYIGFTDIRGHRDMLATSCPGKNFPLEEIKAAVIKPKNYYIQTQEYNGWFDALELYNKFFKDSPRFYPIGTGEGKQKYATSYLPYDKCVAIQRALYENGITSEVIGE